MLFTSTSTIFVLDLWHNLVVLDWQLLMGSGHLPEVVTHGSLTVLLSLLLLLFPSIVNCFSTLLEPATHSLVGSKGAYKRQILLDGQECCVMFLRGSCLWVHVVKVLLLS